MSKKDTDQRLREAVEATDWAQVAALAPKASKMGVWTASAELGGRLVSEWWSGRVEEDKSPASRAKMKWAPNPQELARAQSVAEALAALLGEAERASKGASPMRESWFESLFSGSKDFSNEQAHLIARAFEILREKGADSGPAWNWTISGIGWSQVDPQLATRAIREIQQGPSIGSLRAQSHVAAKLLAGGQWEAAAALLDSLPEEARAHSEMRASMALAGVSAPAPAAAASAAGRLEGWQENLLKLQGLGVPLDQTVLRIAVLRGQMPVDACLGWILAQSPLPGAPLSVALAEMASFAFGVSAGSNPATKERAAAAVEWMLKKSVDLDEESWESVARTAPPALAALGERLRIKAPGRALIALAKTTAQGSADAMAWLLEEVEFSAHERGCALAETIGHGDEVWPKMSLLLPGEPISSERLTQALEVYAYAGDRRHEDETVARGLLKHGANAKGTAGNDGLPLRFALDRGRFELAREIANAGGWGSAAEKWLKKAFAKPDIDARLADWQEILRAHCEQRELGRALKGAPRKRAKKAPQSAQSATASFEGGSPGAQQSPAEGGLRAAQGVKTMDKSRPSGGSGVAPGRRRL